MPGKKKKSNQGAPPVVASKSDSNSLSPNLVSFNTKRMEQTQVEEVNSQLQNLKSFDKQASSDGKQEVVHSDQDEKVDEFQEEDSSDGLFVLDRFKTAKLVESFPLLDVSRESLKIWLMKFVYFCGLMQIPERLWASCVVLRLSPTDLSFFLEVCVNKNVSTDDFVWNACKRLLKHCFHDKDQLVWRKKYQDLKMQESMLTFYISEFTNVAEKLHYDVNSKMVLSRFLFGLTPMLQQQLGNIQVQLKLSKKEGNQSSKPVRITFAEWCDYAKQCDESNSKFRSLNAFPIADVIQDQIKIKPKVNDGRCRRCNQLGHFIANCPMPHGGLPGISTYGVQTAKKQ